VALSVAVTAPPVDGKANDALIRLLARLFHLPPRDLSWRSAPATAARWCRWLAIPPAWHLSSAKDCVRGRHKGDRRQGGGGGAPRPGRRGGARAGCGTGLATVLVGADPASEVYVRAKHKAALEAGFRNFEHKLPATTTRRSC